MLRYSGLFGLVCNSASPGAGCNIKGLIFIHKSHINPKKISTNRAKRPIHLPGIGVPQQMQYFHQMQYLEIKYPLYVLPIQKVPRHPVGITHFFSAID